MDSIILEVFRSYILDVWFTMPQAWVYRLGAEMLPYTARELGIYLALFLPALFLQLLTLGKCCRIWLRWLPLMVSVGCLILAEVLYAVLDGWNRILGLALAVGAWYWLLGALAAALVWRLFLRKKYPAV